MLGRLFGARLQQYGLPPDRQRILDRPWEDPRWAYPPLEAKTLMIFGESVEFTAHKPRDVMCCHVEYRGKVRGVPVEFNVPNEWCHEFEEDRSRYEQDVEDMVGRKLRMSSEDDNG